jgi:S-methylmethionine-dependent homocysteine/selenocysteine methylase
MTAHPTAHATNRESRVSLPTGGDLWLTDAGLETELVFKDGLELPCFSAAPLLDSESGRDRLHRYYTDFVELASQHGLGLVLETATWRVSPDWVPRLDLDDEAAARIHREGVALLQRLRDEGPLPRERFVVSGNLGPRYDGYQAADRMTSDEALDYHRPQVALFAAEGVDVITALTLTTSDEAIGIARAAAAEGVPAVISFTVETDGRLPSGETLGFAIEAADAAAPHAITYYGINCAHPTHFLPALEAGDDRWRGRIGLVRSNASSKSHAELDESTELDEGDPAELAGHTSRLRALLPELRVIGGCCGTDIRHVSRMSDGCKV